MAPRKSDDYQLSIAGAARRRLYDLHEQAARNGRGRALADAFRKIVPLLRSDPVACGRYEGDLPNLGLAKYSITEPPLTVVYCVDAARRIVYLQSFKPSPDGSF